MRRAKTAEVRVNLQAVSTGAAAYYLQERASPTGEVLPPSFPPSVGETPGVPTDIFCKDGQAQPVMVGPEVFSDPTWKALGFAPSGRSHYSYEFISAGTGNLSHFTVRARGDLDCDGVLSTFERVGTLDATGFPRRTGLVRTDNELE